MPRGSAGGDSARGLGLPSPSSCPAPLGACSAGGEPVAGRFPKARKLKNVRSIRLGGATGGGTGSGGAAAALGRLGTFGRFGGDGVGETTRGGAGVDCGTGPRGGTPLDARVGESPPRTTGPGWLPPAFGPGAMSGGWATDGGWAAHAGEETPETTLDPSSGGGWRIDGGPGAGGPTIEGGLAPGL